MPTRATREMVLSKCDYFTDVQLWPLKTSLQPEQWLSNFTVDELPFAVHLLDTFMYFSESLCNSLFIASFQTLSRFFRASNDNYLTSQAAWKAFVNSVRITYVTGEEPSPTDSGFIFARKARQLLGIPEERIQSPEDTARELIRKGPKPVVFVDDFVGSGSQFLSTWERPVPMSAARDVTFARLAKVRGQEFYYCPLVCCQGGYETIQANAPEAHLNCGHIIPRSYSAVAADSVLWPPSLLPDAFKVIKAASDRAGLPDTDGTAVNDWQGFRKLGLTLAFQHCVPDATLPLFYWEQNGWNPLVRRT